MLDIFNAAFGTLTALGRKMRRETTIEDAADAHKRELNEADERQDDEVRRLISIDDDPFCE